MPRLVLWRKNRFVKKPSPLKNAVLADDPKVIDTQPAAHPLDLQRKQEETSIKYSDSTSEAGGEVESHDQLLTRKGKEAPIPRRGWIPTNVHSVLEPVAHTKKRKALHQSSIENNTNVDTTKIFPPITAPHLHRPSPQYIGNSTSHITPAPDSQKPRFIIKLRVPTRYKAHHFLSAQQAVTTSNYSHRNYPQPREPPGITLLSRPPAIHDTSPSHDRASAESAPSPDLTPTSLKPSLIVKLNVPIWYEQQQLLIPQPNQVFQTSQALQTSKETRKPASQASKCSTCGGIHASTCISNMDRLDEINAQVSFLSILSKAAGMIINEVLEGVEQPSGQGNQAGSAFASSFSSTASKLEKRDSKNATITTKMMDLDTDPEAEAKDLRRRIEGLVAEGDMWIAKARPLILEAAMREGNLEEGEKLRREIKQDGVPVRAGEAERYFAGVREKYLGRQEGKSIQNLTPM
ncbi:hypothetical protein ONS95_009190 [Cadophora gregata]|uniref:uncharacterized protein n=1 Tax=Cadophora gregata TaxID=51156 RepID=UPI0026DD4C5B|nr:uncharacterized protein ONS95_009190 [Cadophora gregata]KAK0124210.1 hypothetical protein ONS95_009190 [Cadophora gregata]KAK0129935.1 hypothetical protein ONS96_000477 [Cadophora gregata f. sp. sojae]